MRPGRIQSAKNTNRPSFALYQGAAYYKDFDQMVIYFSNQVADNMEVWHSDGTVGNTARLIDVHHLQLFKTKEVLHFRRQPLFRDRKREEFV